MNITSLLTVEDLDIPSALPLFGFAHREPPSWSTIVCEPLADVPSTPSQIHLGFRGSPTPENPYLFNLDWVKLS